MFEKKINTIQAHIVTNTNETIEFLVLQRASHLQIYPSIWQVVTGNIENNETALQAAIRECFEETGLKPLKIWTIPYLTSFFDAYKNEIHFSPVFGFFVEKQLVNISSEHQDYKWIKHNELNDYLVLPSHLEASKIFYKHILTPQILEKTQVGLFEVNLNQI